MVRAKQPWLPIRSGRFDAEMLAACAIALCLTAFIVIAGLPLLLLPARLDRP